MPEPLKAKVSVTVWNLAIQADVRPRSKPQLRTSTLRTTKRTKRTTKLRRMVIRMKSWASRMSTTKKPMRTSRMRIPILSSPRIFLQTKTSQTRSMGWTLSSPNSLMETRSASPPSKLPSQQRSVASCRWHLGRLWETTTLASSPVS